MATGRATAVAGYDLEVFENSTLTDPMRFALISALTSMQADAPAGWNRIVQGAILPEHVKRLDNRTVRVELPPVSGYQIDAPVRSSRGRQTSAAVLAFRCRAWRSPSAAARLPLLALRLSRTSLATLPR